MATIFGDVHDNWLKGTNHGDTVRATSAATSSSGAVATIC